MVENGSQHQFYVVKKTDAALKRPTDKLLQVVECSILIKYVVTVIHKANVIDKTVNIQLQRIALTN